MAVYRCSGSRRSRFLGVAVATSVVFSFMMGYIIYYADSTQFSKFQISKYSDMEEQLIALQNKMRFLERQYLQKQEEIVRLQVKLKEKYNETNSEIRQEQIEAYAKITAIMEQKNEPGIELVKPVAEPEPLQVSFIHSTMAHLLLHPRSVCPAFQVLSPRTNVDVVIGVPTVHRDKENYLENTVVSLVEGMIPAELEKTLIVVMVGELDMEYVVEISTSLNKLFPKYFGQLIEVISPTSHWYPDWNELDQNLGDSLKRVLWRTKQNLDAIFLMSYCQNRGQYYLMLEDDVIATKRYMTDMMQFVASTTVSNPKWFYINFCTVGGIGKFFKSESVAFFSAYVQVLYKYLPVDWLMELYLAGRTCGIDSSSKQCGNLKEEIRPTFKRSLFAHIGVFSSLKGKYSKVKPGIRKEALPLFYGHQNPPLDFIDTLIIAKDNHTIERAYKGEDFFWGITPKNGDTIDFWFEKPVRVDRFFFRTGHPSQTKDILKKGTVHIRKPGFEDFVYQDEFDEFGNAEGYIDHDIGPLSAIRILITADMTSWLIISEIEITAVAESNHTSS